MRLRFITRFFGDGDVVEALAGVVATEVVSGSVDCEVSLSEVIFGVFFEAFDDIKRVGIIQILCN